MEVAVQVASPLPQPPIAFINLDRSACSFPYISAPSSPQRPNKFFYFSAPTSPTRSSFFFKHPNDTYLSTPNPFSSSSSSSTIPFQWEEKPGTPKAKTNIRAEDHGGDFEFYFSSQLNKSSLSAEELFDKGKIRPLKPPPGYGFSSQASSPRSPCPRNKKSNSDFDPFEAALEETRKREVEQERGRERTSSIRKKVTSRSLSPLKVSGIFVSGAEESKQKGHKKWKLKDLLLFWSASEGRPSSSKSATRGIGSGNRDFSPGKYLVLSRKEMIDDVKNCSFRSTEGSVSRRRMSSGEARYTANRAMLKDMIRKASSAYKQGLLRRLFRIIIPGTAD